MDSKPITCCTLHTEILWGKPLCLPGRTDEKMVRRGKETQKKEVNKVKTGGEKRNEKPYDPAPLGENVRPSLPRRACGRRTGMLPVQLSWLQGCCPCLVFHHFLTRNNRKYAPRVNAAVHPHFHCMIGLQQVFVELMKLLDLDLEHSQDRLFL